MHPLKLARPISVYALFKNLRRSNIAFCTLKIFFFSVCLFSGTALVAQKNSAGIELNPFVRKDWYRWIRYERPAGASDSILMNGVSFGLSISYKFPLGKAFAVKAGIGYFKYRFNKITNINAAFGTSDHRIINYPSPNYIVFNTDRYSYNTFLINTGLERQVSLNGKLNFTLGVAANNYFTFSQSFHIDASRALGPPNGKYRTNDFRYYGTSASLYVSLFKSIGKMQLSPTLTIPLFDLWKQDDIFPGELDGRTRSKIGRGVGLGLSLFIPLTLNK